MNTQNEPKYYLIQNNNPESKHYKKYYEVKDEFYYENYFNATFCPTEQIAIGYIKKLNLNAVVATKTETEVKVGIHSKLVKSAFFCEIMKAEIDATSSNFPNKTYYGKKLKGQLNLTAKALQDYGISFQTLIEVSNEDTAYDNHLIVQNMLESFVAIQPEDFMDLTDILTAFKYDKKAIMGIVKKIAQDKERKEKEKIACKNQLSILDQV